MENLDPVAIWEASPLLAVVCFGAFLIWVSKRYPDHTPPAISKADDLFAANNEMFRAVLIELREIKRVLNDINVEQIRNGTIMRTNQRD